MRLISYRALRLRQYKFHDITDVESWGDLEENEIVLILTTSVELMTGALMIPITEA